jgi:hypothetical protein
MAIRKDNAEKAEKKEGLIQDQNEEIRYDSGEAAKDEYDAADAYEKDQIELRGIVIFTVGLIAMVVLTFVLMALLQRAMEEQVLASEKGQQSKMAMSPRENLPPEPRLQAAPGFQVVRKDGKVVNLELREPQSEYRELRKEWQEIWENGYKDPNTGTVQILPIEEAKKKVLENGTLKTRSADQAQKAAETVKLMPSYQTSGRNSEIRRQ